MQPDQAYLHSWEFLIIPRNSQKTGNSVGKGYLHNWEFLRIPQNSQKTGNSVRKGTTSIDRIAKNLRPPMARMKCSVHYQGDYDE